MIASGKRILVQQITNDIEDESDRYRGYRDPDVARYPGFRDGAIKEIRPPMPERQYARPVSECVMRLSSSPALAAVFAFILSSVTGGLGVIRWSAHDGGTAVGTLILLRLPLRAGQARPGAPSSRPRRRSQDVLVKRGASRQPALDGRRPA